MEKAVKIPEKVEVDVQGSVLKAKGEKGENLRDFSESGVILSKEGDKIIIKTKSDRKEDKRNVGTTVSHIKNILNGVKNLYMYKLKIKFSHFPITIKIEGKLVRIDNFFGERAPRHTEIVGNAKVEVNGQDITVSGVDKEAVGQTAANFEMATRITKRDRRVFTDGIWIISKGEGE